ncbi:1-aminocyclopropane-1-carboxylate deaminase/D-cysteine desulfhydrase [Aquirufa sp. ROCK2-A2]
MDIQTLNLLNLNLPSPIEEITNDLCEKKNIKLFIKRDDLINPFISGNKWRKLRDYIEIAQINNKRGFISFGGAYSNHLYALAYLGYQLNFSTIGLVRGDELTINSNPFLQQMDLWGMKMIFLDRDTYKRKEIPSNIFNHDQYLIIPEGGYSEVGINSVESLSEEIQCQGNFNYISLAVGTGTTAIGLSKFSDTQILGILSLNNLEEIQSHQSELNHFSPNLIFMDQLEKKKYGRKNEELEQFCADFYQENQIKIEPIYTGKMFYRLYQLISEDYFPVNSKILAIHTGGLK